MRLRFTGFRLVSAFVLLTATVAIAQGPRPRPFSEVAVEAFDEWDADDDGTLSPAEIDQLVVSPLFTGERGAALAALKLVVRSSKVKPPTLTLDFVQNRSREPAGELLPSELANTPEPTAPSPNPDGVKPPTPRSSRPPASLERRYQSAIRKIRSASSDLFADETPDIARCRQGPLGSCFFVAGVGAFVDRDPDALKAMIVAETTATGETTYAVRFGDGRSVNVPSLTDAQRGLTSSAGPDGLWLTVLEQAYGSLRMRSRQASRRTLEASDALASGGSLSTTLRVLTGHAIDRVRLRSNADKDPELVARVSKILGDAVRGKRLAGANTGSTAPLPPGINGKHAYAVLGFDHETDRVKLWNPHGNTFRPRGEPGIERGYSTRGGVFEVPVAEFVRIFDSLVVETDRPGGSAPTRR